MSKYHHIKQWTTISAVSVFIVVILASCTKNFQKENATYAGPASANLLQLYSGIGSIIDATAEAEDANSTRWLLPITQQGAVYARSDYGFGGGANWPGFYQNLAATYQMFSQISATKADSVNYTNLKAMLLVLRAYQAIELSNFYGDIPYSKAGKAFSGKVSDLTVPYDKQQAVYISCLKDLTWAVNNLDSTSTTQYSLGSKEFLFNNNIGMWAKFANSLRLRYALTMYDKDQADAGPIIADALTKNLLAAPVADVAGLSQTNIPGISFDLGGGGRGWSFRQECRLRMGTTMWNLFNDGNNTDGSGIFDLRAKIFFEVNGAGEWVPYPQNPLTATTDGGDPYNTARDADWNSEKTGNLFSNFNYYWGRDGNIAGSTNACPEIFMTPAEVHFLKAEAYARGAGVGANPALAESEYNAGITASLTFWNNMAYNSSVWAVNKPVTAVPDDAAIALVLNNAKVKWNAENALSLIYAQEWIDLFRQPWVAWTLMRRTGNATPADTNNPAGYTQNYGSLQRYTYPGDEQLLNNANWKVAMGGNDATSTKIWIAK